MQLKKPQLQLNSEKTPHGTQVSTGKVQKEQESKNAQEKLTCCPLCPIGFLFGFVIALVILILVQRFTKFAGETSETFFVT